LPKPRNEVGFLRSSVSVCMVAGIGRLKYLVYRELRR